jgi:hypothetical protein
VFPPISFGGFSIGRISLIVPTCSSASDEEAAGFNEEEDSPEQIEDMNSAKCENGIADFEVRVRVLMFCEGRSS